MNLNKLEINQYGAAVNPRLRNISVNVAAKQQNEKWQLATQMGRKLWSKKWFFFIK